MTDSPMRWQLESLTHELTQSLLPQLLDIDSAMIGEPWSQEQWLFDVPGKWELSRVARAYDGSVIGFLVASMHQDAVHIHRVAVAATHRGEGLGRTLLYDAATHAARAGRTSLSLKVNTANKLARAFYEGLGFTVAGQSADNLLMIAPCSVVTRSGATTGQ